MNTKVGRMDSEIGLMNAEVDRTSSELGLTNSEVGLLISEGDGSGSVVTDCGGCCEELEPLMDRATSTKVFNGSVRFVVIFSISLEGVEEELSDTSMADPSSSVIVLVLNFYWLLVILPLGFPIVFRVSS
ncbi:hypothetical protein L6452_38938 [Arctium lappa]|uniref:Uncharacterized protein n=1 Tax=Arctium lappa TaxID=4217 RepID=A0ACB8XQX3_ARCLA|nr:hypothetical protein L6452_38938 [Arctium lappa]